MFVLGVGWDGGGQGKGKVFLLLLNAACAASLTSFDYLQSTVDSFCQGYIVIGVGRGGARGGGARPPQ